MQRTTVLRAADGSLENTFQPASHRMTANESAAGKVSSAPEKSRNHCALMWTCPAAKYSQILRRLITRRLRCYFAKCVHSTEISHDDGRTFYPRCYDDEEEAVHCVDVMDQRLCATLHTCKIYWTNKTRMLMMIIHFYVYFLRACVSVWLRKAVCGILDPQKYQWGMQDHAVQPCCNCVCACARACQRVQGFCLCPALCIFLH